ncbi:MAG: hypothetical protein IPP83_05250 [Flavobacteriales bacterium]|nr:hypothetical protein [Flavobacteriales bacterium]
MSRTLSILLSLLLALPTLAQGRSYDDLLVMYVDENYEKCIDKAEHYASKDETRRDAMPYLYLSMCYHEMSKLEKYTMQKEYKYAARDALKYAVKYRKKDKELAFFKNFEDYWSELNTVAFETGYYYMDLKAFSKAKRQYARMVGYMPENPGAWQMLALTQLKMNLQRDAALSLAQYDTAMTAIPDLSRLPPDQLKLLRGSMVRYADYLVTKGQTQKARDVVARGKDVFMEIPEFKALYEQLNKGAG